MSTYFDDFSGYSDGTFESVASANWTRTNSVGNWTNLIATDGAATGGKKYITSNLDSYGNLPQLYRCDAGSSTSGDIDAVARIKYELNKAVHDFPAGVVIMDSTGASYYLRYTAAGTWRLARGDNVADIAAHVGAAVGSLYAPTAGTYFWMRIGRSGTTIQAKIWSGNPEDEPGSWQVTGTDTTLTTLYGGIGVKSYIDGDVTVDVIGIGIGQSAPTSSVSGAGVPKTTKLAMLGVG